jgi:hypothetical protein
MQRRITAFLKGRSAMTARFHGDDKSMDGNNYSCSDKNINKNISLVADATKPTTISISAELTKEAEGYPCDAGFPSAARDLKHAST